MADENKIGNAENKKRIPWMKNKHHSEESLQKIRDNRKGKGCGRIKSQEEIELLRNIRLGKKFGPMSEEHRKNLSKSLIGKPHKKGNQKSRKGIPSGFIPKTAFKKGIKPWNYIDGRSGNKGYTDRYGKDWPDIRNKVLVRDNYVCQKCNIDNVKMEVHHIIAFALTKDNLFDNLITLCKKCHRKIEALEMKMLKSKNVA